MSTSSKVKRQVRRNARETPRVRRRREEAARLDRWLAWLPSMCDIHHATMSTMLGADAKAIVVAFYSPGGPLWDFNGARCSFGGFDSAPRYS